MLFIKIKFKIAVNHLGSVFFSLSARNRTPVFEICLPLWDAKCLALWKKHQSSRRFIRKRTPKTGFCQFGRRVNAKRMPFSRISKWDASSVSFGRLFPESVNRTPVFLKVDAVFPLLEIGRKIKNVRGIFKKVYSQNA